MKIKDLKLYLYNKKFIELVFLLIIHFTFCKKLTLATDEIDFNKLIIKKTDRILIIAPHPDDEALACSGIIRYAVEKNIPIRIVVMTSGDGYRKNVELQFKTLSPTPKEFQKLGKIRYHESIKAMEVLRLDKRNITFLTYPDGGINSLFDINWDYNKLHRSLNGVVHSPYNYSYERYALYCGENVARNLEEIKKTN